MLDLLQTPQTSAEKIGFHLTLQKLNAKPQTRNTETRNSREFYPNPSRSPASQKLRKATHTFLTL